ncbi:hypothetical protein RJ639_003947, partial [Escallonia herrerae]
CYYTRPFTTNLHRLLIRQPETATTPLKLNQATTTASTQTSCVSRGSDSVASGDARDGHSIPGCLDTGCVICLSEFAPGERVRVLPKCSHGFHMVRIDEWLLSHSSFHTHRHCLIQTYQQSVGMNQPPLPLPLL